VTKNRLHHRLASRKRIPTAITAAITSAIATALSACVVGLSAPLSAAAAPATAAEHTLWQLDGSALHQRDAQGQEQGRWPVRSKQMDSRPARDGQPALAAVLDGDLAQPVLLEATVQGPHAWTPLPVRPMDIESLCLGDGPQGQRWLILLGGDGVSEQWLLQASGHQLVRRFAVPAGSKACAVDDATAQLYVSTPALGVWRLDLNREAPPALQPVALREKKGPLNFAPGALRIAQDQLWVHEQKGQREWHTTLAPLPRPALPEVPARAQTEPVSRFGDAADDPAIWRDPADPAHSLVLGTNKKEGLVVYDLQGRLRQSLPVGRLNNVDLRQQVRAGSQRMDVAVSTHRDEHALALFAIDAKGTVRDLGRVVTPLAEIYGVCAAKGADGDLQAIVNDKDGTVLQLRLAPRNADGSGPWEATELRRFKLATQPEGCVVDEQQGHLFVGEEDRGVWMLPLRPGTPAQAQLILKVGGLVQADVEGLALFDGPHGRYLVISSQGNDSYVVMDAQAPFTVRGAFRIGLNAAAGIDGTSDTDGLEVTSLPMGPDYPGGLLVVQDGHKLLPPGPQNFKLVDWRDVAAALKLP
jgi:3-phytase